ncbi:MAG: PepSY domain-containing protein [Desulfobulbaceae bacterium]|nr:PepSY domain-containing protein [Desulfobulbaceae bacterium]
MKSKSIFPVLLASGLFFILPATAGTSELPPPDSKSLSAILQALEAQKSGVITEAEFDDGLLEVKVCDAGDCRKLYIDPISGEEKRRKKTGSEETPPANAIPLSTIVESVESRGLGIITEVEFEKGFWEIELRNGRKIELNIDPVTGEEKR